METKKGLIKFCWDYLSQKKEVLLNRSASLQESLNSETKSSAGDKHETGRAMVQLEQEKLAKQLLELDKMAMTLKQVERGGSSPKVSLGSLVKTSAQSYFISISCGEYIADSSDTTFCISISSPIAKLLLGKEEGDTFDFRGRVYEILELI